MFDEAEEDMDDEEGMELAKTAMEELGEEMGADPELMARITQLSRKTGKKDRVGPPRAFGTWRFAPDAIHLLRLIRQISRRKRPNADH